MLPNSVCNPSIRGAGFGPMINSHLTSCFVDVILIPLPTWLLLVFGLPLLLATSPPASVQPHPTKLFRRVLHWIYRLLVLAALLMQILEIVRLGLSDSGIGLLPFGLAGLICAMGLIWSRATMRRKASTVGGILLAYWALLVVFQSVKVDSLVYLEKQAKAQGSKGPSKYPDSDKSLDNYVVLALFAIFFAYELLNLLFLERGAQGHPANVETPSLGSVVKH
ncbi:hypothetical protein T439DRAFT_352980 [Meredithblackwellia eburnea MCA 4105]